MSAARRWLRFAAGGLDVMVAASAFRRSLPVPEPLSCTVDLEGERYPVVALETLAGAARGERAPSLLLVLAADDARLALPAAEVSGTVDLAPEDLAPLPWPYCGGSGWCAGVMLPGEEGGRPVLALDLAGLVRTAAADEALAGEAAS